MSQSSTARLYNLETGVTQEIPATGGRLTATGASDLYIDLRHEIVGSMRVGDDLIINLVNGGQIIVRNFFAFGSTGDVLDAIGAPVELDPEVKPEAEPETGDGTLNPWIQIGIVAVLVAGGVALGDDDAASATAPTPPDPDPTPGPTAAEQALETINAYTGTGTAPTVANYSAAGVTGVTADNLTGVNAQVAASTNNALTAADINPFVTATNTATTTINAYTGSNTAPTANDYSNIGADGVTAANLAGVNAQVAASSDDTLTAADIASFISAAATSLTTINGYTGSNTAPTANDYRNIGATGVNATNLAGVNAQVASSSDDSLTAADIAGFITATNAAFTTINAYDGTNTAPTAANYESAGVDGITAANLDGVNAQVAASSDDSLTPTDLEGFVTAAATSLTTINAYDGENTAPTLNDYRNVGVTVGDNGVTAANLAALNSEVSRVEEGTTLDTMAIEMLLPRANILARINAWDGTADAETPAPTPEDYAAVGVTGITAERIDVANAMLAAENADKEAGTVLNTEQLQALLDIAQDMEGALGTLPPASTMTVTTGSFNIRIDIDGDGTPDMLVEVETNEAGIPTSITYDFDNDGTTDRSERYTVDTDGDRTEAAIDLDADGTADQTRAYTVNAAGRRTLARINTDAEGSVDRIETYTLNAAGQRTGAAIDTNADGTVDQRETYTLNAAGIRTGVTIDTANNGTVDGTVDRRETYTLNAAGQRTQTEFDDNNDGTVDRRETYTLNAAGQRTATTFDGDADGDGTADGTADGTVDRRETYDLNAAGQRRATSFFDRDANGTVDGTADRSETYDLNAVGQITETEFDDDADGNPDRTVTNDNLPPVTAAERAVAALARINAYRTGGSTEPSIADYATAGVTGVTTTAIRDQLNMLVRGQQSSNDDLTAATLQPLVTAANAAVALATLNAWDGDPDGNGNPSAPTLADYTAAGVGSSSAADAVTAANIAGVNARLAGITQAQTVTQIDTLVTQVTTALTTINNWDGDPNDDGTPPAPTLTDYQNAGADDVTAANLAGVNHRLGGITQAQTVTQINTLAGQVTTALATLNAWDGDPDNNGNPSAPTLAVYQNAGIDGVTAANLDEVNMRLGPVTDTLSAADITALANAGASELALGRINDYRTGDSTTAPGIADYIAVGLTGVTTAIRNELNSLVDGHGTVLTVTNIEPLFDMAVTTVALDAINDYRTGDSTTAPSEADYMNAGVTLTTAAGAVTASVLAALNALVRERESDTDDLTATTIQPLVATANTNVALATINAYRTDPDNVTPPTQAVYTAAGATGANAVTADNLAAVNLQVVALGSTAVTASTLGGLVTAANTAITMALTTINAYDGDNTEPTDTNYQTLGVTGITATNLPGVNAQVAASSDDSLERADIQTFVTNANDSLARIRAYTGSNTEPTLTDYLNVGVEDVTAAFGNLARVNEQVEDTAANARSSLTPTQIQALVTAAALDKINDYRMDQTDSDNTLTTDDYRIAGINNVSDDILTDLNAWVAMQANALQMPAIQAQATMLDNESGAAAARAIINAWDGDPDGNSMPPAPTITDYMTARVTGLVEDNLEFYNNRVAGLSTQTLDELNTLVSQANAALVIINAYDGSNTEPTTAHYTNIGLAGDHEVTNANLAGVNAKLADAPANMRELSNLQTFVTTTNAALETINGYNGSNTEPQPSDYQNAGAEDVTADNLEAVNARLATISQAQTVTQINALAEAATAALAVIDAWDGDSDGDGTPAAPTNDHYRDIGLAGDHEVTNANLAGVNAQLATAPANMRELSNLQTFVTTTNAALETINGYNGSNTEPQLADYTNAGAEEVTADNLEAVNARLATISQAQTVTQINTLAEAATTALAVIDAWDGDSDGDGTPAAPTNDHYRDIGLAGDHEVTATNRAGVNAQLATAPANMRELSNLQTFVTTTNAALETINGYNGSNTEPQLADYTNAGAEDVTADNREAVNARLSNISQAQTVTQIDALAEAATAALAVIDAWDGDSDGDGTPAAPTTDHYRDIGLAGDHEVTATNRAGVNAQLADAPANMRELSNLQTFVTTTNAALETINGYNGSNTEPQLADYTNAGAEDVTADNREAVNARLSTINQAQTVTQIDTLAEAATAALAVIDAWDGDSDGDGTPTRPTNDHYRDIGLAGDHEVTATNLAGVNAQLATAPANMRELSNLRTFVTTTNAALETINDYNGSNTEPTLPNYQNAGAEDVTADNLEAVNARLSSISQAQTVTQIDALAEAATAALAVIDAYTGSNAAPTTDHYRDIGLAGDHEVTATNLAGVNAQLATAPANMRELSNLQTFVTTTNAALETINNWDGDPNNDGTPPAPTLINYQNAGADDVTDANLAGVNFRLSSITQTQSVTQINTLAEAVTAALATLNAWDGDPDSNGNPSAPTLPVYQNAGIDGVTAANLDEVNGRVAGVSTALSAAAITVLANAGAIELALVRINDYRTGASATAPSEADYIAVGATGVTTTAILDALNMLVLGRRADNDDLDAMTILSLAAMAITSVALATINAYRTGDSATAPSEADYTAAGVTGVTTTAIRDALNMLVRGRMSDTDDLTETTLEPLVAQATINAYDGTGTQPTVDTYTTAGFTGVNADNLTGVNARVATSQVDPLTQSNIDNFVALVAINAYDGTGTMPTVATYTSAGFTGVNADNLTAVNALVGASQVDPLMQSHISGFVINAYAGTGTMPTVATYTSAGFTGVNADNLAGVNARVATSPVDPLTQSNIDNFVALVAINAYDGTGTAPTVATYTTAGFTGVNADNLDGVNTRVAASSVDPLEQSHIDSFVALEAINAWDGDPDDNGNPSAPTLTVYQNAGADAVNADNLDGVNARLAALSATQDEDEINTIAGQVTSARITIDGYDGSDPTAAPLEADYTNAGISGVDANNLAGVNARVSTEPGDQSVARINTIAGEVTTALATLNAYDGTDPANGPAVAVYTNAGVTGVTDDNRAAVNVQVLDASQNPLTTDIIQTLVTAANTALQMVLTEINAYNGDNTAPDLDDYQLVGVFTVTALYLPGVNAQVADSSNANLARTDILPFVTNANDSLVAIRAWDGANPADAPTAMNYLNVGVTDVTDAIGNLDRVNMLVANPGGRPNAAVAEIQAFVTAAALDKINDYREDQRDSDNTNDNRNTPTTDDYRIAGVTDVTGINLDAVNTKVGEQAANLTAMTIQPLVTEADDELGVSGALETIRAWDGNNVANTEPTAQHYIDAGVTGVTDGTDGNLTDVNAQVAAQDPTDRMALTTMQVQALVAKVDALAKINAYETGDTGDNIPDLDDYTAAEATAVTDANLQEVNARLAGISATQTETQINTLVTGEINPALAVINAYTGPGTTAPTTDHYEAIGLTGESAVTTTNLAGVNAQVATAGTGMRRFSNIQTFVDNTNTALETIRDYDDANTDTAPTLAHYTNAGVTDVTEDIRGALNREVLGTGSTVLDVAAIQALVTKVVALATLNAWDGDPDDNGNPSAPILADYTAAGADAVTADNLDGVNARLAALSAAQDEDQINTIAGEVTTALTTINAYDGDGTPAAAQLTDYTNAGVTGVTAANLAGVNERVATESGNQSVTRINTIAEQVTDALATLNAWDGDPDDNGNPSAPTLADYTAAGITEVTADNLDLVNRRLATVNNLLRGTGLPLGTAEDIINEVEALNTALNIINAYDGSNAVPELTHYEAAGFADVTAANLPGVNAQVAPLTDNATSTIITGYVTTTSDAFTTINDYETDPDTNTAPAPAVYTNVGLVGDHAVTQTNLTQVNRRVANSKDDDLTFSDLQAIVTAANAAIDALEKIDDYRADQSQSNAPLVADYEALLGANSGVTMENVADVNSGVAGAGSTPLTEARIRGIIALVVINAYDGDGTPPAPTYVDYAALGITGVTPSRATFANQLVAQAGDLDEDQLQRLITVVANLESVFDGVLPPAAGVTVTSSGGAYTIAISSDSDSDPELSVTLDGLGATMAVEYDFNNDGTADRNWNYAESTNAQGTVESQTITIDVNSDNTTDRTEIYTINADGERTRGVFHDDGNTMEADRIEVYHLNAAGVHTRTDFHDDGNSATDPDRIEHYNTRDANGQLTQISFDFDGDDSIDRIEVYTLDAAGRRMQTNFYDDGTMEGTDDRGDRIETYGLAPSGPYFGLLNRVEIDSNADTTTDTIYSYLYNNAGHLIQNTISTPGGGDSIERYAVNEAGHRTSTTFDLAADNDFNFEFGLQDYMEHYLLTADGNRRVTFRINAEDGNTDDRNVDRIDFHGGDFNQGVTYTLPSDASTIDIANAPNGFGLVGLSEIHLHQADPSDPASRNSNTEFTISSATVAAIANGTTDHEIRIQGNMDDTVNLDGQFDDPDLVMVMNNPFRRIVARDDSGNQVGILLAPFGFLIQSLSAAALSKINAYNGNNDAPEVADYTAAGVTGVTTDNRDDINKLVAEWNSENAALDLTAADLQRFVALNKIENYDGTGDALTHIDYAAAGIVDAFPSRISFLNLLVGEYDPDASNPSNPGALTLQNLTVVAAALENFFGTQLPTNAMEISSITEGFEIDIDFDNNGTDDVTVQVKGTARSITVSYQTDNDPGFERIETYESFDPVAGIPQPQAVSVTGGASETFTIAGINASRFNIFNLGSGQFARGIGSGEAEFLRRDDDGHLEFFAILPDISAFRNELNTETYSETYTLNANKERIRIDFDVDGDKTVDRIETYTLNDAGHRTKAIIYTDGNIGANDPGNRIETYRVNASGHRTFTEFDNDASETYNAGDHRIYYQRTYSGNLLAAFQVDYHATNNNISSIDFGGGFLNQGVTFTLPTDATTITGLTDAPANLGLSGLGEINLDGTNSVTEFTIDSATVAAIATGATGGTSHEVLISGDAGDTVNLTGTFSEAAASPETRGTITYTRYNALDASDNQVGVLLVQTGVQVSTASGAALAKIRAYTSSVTDMDMIPNVDDYTAAGVTGVTTDNLDDINELVADWNEEQGNAELDLTATDLQGFVALDKIRDYRADSSTNPAPVAQDYRDLLGTDAPVTDANVASYNTRVRDSGETNLMESDILTLVTEVNAMETALAKINAYTSSTPDADAPTLADYMAAGFTGVTAKNLPGVNAQVAASSESDLMASHITGFVTATDNAFTTINNYQTATSNGAPSAQHYTNVGLRGAFAVTADNLDAVNNQVAMSGDTDFTLMELQMLVGVASALPRLEAYRMLADGDITDDNTPTIQDYLNLLGNDAGVNQGRLNAYNMAVRNLQSATDPLTLTTVQGLVATVNMEAALPILEAYRMNGGTAPDISDYRAALGPDATIRDANLGAYNTAVQGAKEALTLDSLQALVSTVNPTEALARINTYRHAANRRLPLPTAPTFQDWEDIANGNFLVLEDQVDRYNTALEGHGNDRTATEYNNWVVSGINRTAAEETLNAYEGTGDAPKVIDYVTARVADTFATRIDFLNLLVAANNQIENKPNVLTTWNLSRIVGVLEDVFGVLPSTGSINITMTANGFIIQIDTDNDKMPDASIHVVGNDNNDNNSNPTIAVQYQLDEDSSFERIDNYSFASDRSRPGGYRRTQFEFDTDADDTANFIQGYFAQGENIVVNLITNSGGGNFTGGREVRMQDVDANLTGVDFQVRVDNPGSIDFTTVRTERYGLNALAQRIETRFDDHGMDGSGTADGTTDRIEKYTLNDAGFRIKTEFDNHGANDEGTPDGTADIIETYGVNADGYRTSVEYDSDANGMIDASGDYQEYNLLTHTGNLLAAFRLDAEANNNVDQISFGEGTLNQGVEYTLTDTPNVAGTPTGFSLEGLDTINLHDDTDTELTIASSTIAAIGNNVPDHEVQINGNAGDEVTLTGSFVKVGSPVARDGGMYQQYDATDSNSTLFIEAAINVTE